MSHSIRFLVMLLTSLFCNQMNAATFTIKPQSDLVGEISHHKISSTDTWFSIAYHYDVGYQELRIANPKITSLKKNTGKILIVPTQYILPLKELRKGIVVNLAEKRLYYFPNASTVLTYPVGVGRDGWKSPSFSGRVIGKTVAPTWHVPKSILAYYKNKYGKEYPKTVAPGPNNPLGNYVLRLSMPRILIHGTNDDTSVGKNISSGCMRMYNRNISELFPLVPRKTSVAFIHQDEKIGIKNGDIYYEKNMTYRPEDPQNIYAMLRQLKHAGYDIYADDALIRKLYAYSNGVPIKIGMIGALRTSGWYDPDTRYHRFESKASLTERGFIKVHF